MLAFLCLAARRPSQVLEGTVSSSIDILESSIRTISGLAVDVEILVDGGQFDALQLGISA